MAAQKFFKSGRWNALCGVCRFSFKSDELKQRWDGMMVCERDYEGKHPQDIPRTIKEDSRTPWVRNEVISFCGLVNSQAIAGIGVAGCAVAGRAN